MVNISKIYSKSDIIQSGMPLVGFINSEQDNCIFQSPFGQTDINEIVNATFTNTHHPLESDNADWTKVEIDWNRQSIAASGNNFQAKISLYGIMYDGIAELIGEEITTSISGTLTNKVTVFDLAQSGGEPPLIKEIGSTSSGKIQLKLPMSLENYESITLKHSPYSIGWSKVKILPITGSVDNTYYNYTLMPYTVSYNSNMNPDFSDLRFAIWNGTELTNCKWYLFRKENSNYAIIFIQIPTLVIRPAVTNLYMFYGNPDATTTSDSSIIYYYDDFEDGKFTNRSSPYLNWIINKGSLNIDFSTPISGGYSLVHTGNNSDNITMPIYITTGWNNPLIDINFKLNLQIQGTGSFDPYITLFYLQYNDPYNFLRVDTYWNGTNQLYRLIKSVSGTITTISSVAWSTQKLSLGTHNIRIIAYLPYNDTQYVSLYLDGFKVINAQTPATHFSSNYVGFGCHQYAKASFDNLLIRPYISTSVFNNGNEPTIGTLTSENVVVSPDNWDDSSQSVLFTLTNDYIQNCLACFDIKEINAGIYESPDVILNPTNIFRLGYDHVSKYHALRVVVEVDSDQTNAITVNSIKYYYSV